MKRREFLQSAIAASAIAGMGCNSEKKIVNAPLPEIPATVFYHKNENPEVALQKTINAMGGINAIVNKSDIVVLKVNSQWWNQGMTNTDVIAAFISLVLEIPGFDGEIIVVDNHQAAHKNSLGWTTKFRNGKFNLNELVHSFQVNGFKNVTKFHWHPAGPNPTPLQKDGFGNSILREAVDGVGYVWPFDNYYTSPFGNRCVLAYPSFKSHYSGIGIDLMKGAFENRKYTDQKVTFVNFSSLNHHSIYCGVTASVKNMMGVVDMSCGWPAPLPANTYNTHHVGATILFKFLSNKKILRLKKNNAFRSLYLHPSIFKFQYTGGVLGTFMRKIRKPDLNILAAINVGWGSRTDVKKSFQANTVCASKDPVALDYWAAKTILFPATKRAAPGSVYFELNDPDNSSGPFHRFLTETRNELGGTMNIENIIAIS